ncbi:hypothetical protein EYF80_058416 [Liparis tanakae]|uniref:Uncharacterized protein n=1 Tax=Liparis tanakae TaxID=230148 RepID=A0A4Z2ERL2_9TELE|nr:hypothetical protein EYF80_058416 [Liparis tanakae]
MSVHGGARRLAAQEQRGGGALDQTNLTNTHMRSGAALKINVEEPPCCRNRLRATSAWLRWSDDPQGAPPPAAPRLLQSPASCSAPPPAEPRLLQSPASCSAPPPAEPRLLQSCGLTSVSFHVMGDAALTR